MTKFTSDEIRAEIKRMVANLTEKELDEISDTADFAEELGIDSLTAMEMMMTVDRKFSVDIPEEVFNRAKTVNDSVAMVEHWIAVRDGVAVGA
jgi:acyl carrier protein